MQSLSLTLSKRLSNSKPLFRISSNLVAYASSSSTTTATSSPQLNLPPPPISAANGSSFLSPTLNNFLTAPWSATQSRCITVTGSDVRVGNLIENQGRVYEVLKQYHSLEGRVKANLKVSSHGVAGYATVATTGDAIRSVWELRMNESNHWFWFFSIVVANKTPARPAAAMAAWS